MALHALLYLHFQRSIHVGFEVMKPNTEVAYLVKSGTPQETVSLEFDLWFFYETTSPGSLDIGDQSFC
jgi:hypothetical protein